MYQIMTSDEAVRLIRDNDCIVKADELGITMLLTGERHFKH